MSHVTPPSCRIDASHVEDGRVTAVQMVAGLPQIARHVRMAARQGWAGAAITVADADGARQVEGALAAWPAPAGFAVAVGTHAPAAGAWIDLDGRALYAPAELAACGAVGAAPRPLARLDGPGSLRVAEGALYRALRKSAAQEGVLSFYLIRPLSLRLSRALVATRVTPNQVTLFNLAVGLSAAALAASGGARAVMLAALLYWLTGPIDCVDGDLARLRVQSSRLGEWLDTLADDVTTLAMVAGLGLGLGGGFAWLGAGGAALAALARAAMYLELHRRGLPIDTAAFPWFFRRAARPPRGAARLLQDLLLRRDGYVTWTTLLLLAGQREIAALGLLAGNCAVGPLLLVHALVTHGRSPEARMRHAWRRVAGWLHAFEVPRGSAVCLGAAAARWTPHVAASFTVTTGALDGARHELIVIDDLLDDLDDARAHHALRVACAGLAPRGLLVVREHARARPVSALCDLIEHAGLHIRLTRTMPIGGHGVLAWLIAAPAWLIGGFAPALVGARQQWIVCSR